MRNSPIKFSMLVLAFSFAQEMDTSAVIDTSGLGLIVEDSLEISSDIVSETIEDSLEISSDVVSETSEDSLTISSSIDTFEEIQWDTIPLELMGLDYGYKGYKWGTPRGTIPRLAYMDYAEYSSDSSKVKMSGKLGRYEALITYVYADSGFWKVEIDFQIEQSDIDTQIKQFTAIEKSISEIYGSPIATNQVISGPSSSYSDVLHLRYLRAFYRSSWKVIPCNIELLLSSLVQAPTIDLIILEGNTSILRLVYYNPDYMVLSSNLPEPEKLPSIFDIY